MIKDGEFIRAEECEYDQGQTHLLSNCTTVQEHKMEFRMCSPHILPQSVQDVRVKEHKMEFGMFSPQILFHNQYKM
jgi:hypothetical protein